MRGTTLHQKKYFCVELSYLTQNTPKFKFKTPPNLLCIGLLEPANPSRLPESNPDFKEAILKSAVIFPLSTSSMEDYCPRADVDARELKLRYGADEGRCLPGTCIPAMFTNAKTLEEFSQEMNATSLPIAFPWEAVSVQTEDIESLGISIAKEGAETVPQSSDAWDTFPQSCRELPAHVLPLDPDRPCTLPPGFHLRQTPDRVENSPSVYRKGRQCTLAWEPNLYMLVMGNGYRPLLGRLLKEAQLPDGPDTASWLFLEPIFFAYSIAFHVDVLDRPGVSMQPAFVPHPRADVNFWARQPVDHLCGINTPPPVPPGIALSFERLPRSDTPPDTHLTAAQAKAAGNTGVDALFPLPEATCRTFHDGGLGFLVYRHDVGGVGILDEREHEGQPIILFARCAFGELATAPIPRQRAAVYAAVKYALWNAPRSKNGEVAIALDMQHANQSPEEFGWVSAFAATDAAVVGADGSSAPIRVPFTEAEDHVERQLARWLRREHTGLTWYAACEEASAQMAFSALSKEEVNRGPSVVVPTKTGGVRSFMAADHPQAQATVEAARACVEKWHGSIKPSPNLWNLAPPDVDAFGETPVVVVAVVLRVKLGIAATSPTAPRTEVDLYTIGKAVSDLGTRLMWDMMMLEPQLLVTSTNRETFLMLFTDKAPGELNVKSAKLAVPPESTKTSSSRVVKDPHPALTPFHVETFCGRARKTTTSETADDGGEGGADTDADDNDDEDGAMEEGRGNGAATDRDRAAAAAAPIPDGNEDPSIQRVFPTFDREAANANPLVQMLIRGPDEPFAVPGTEMSLYEPGSKALRTKVAGTCHSWPVHGGLVHKCIHEPKTEAFPWGYFGADVPPEQKVAAVALLHAPLYNVAAGEVWRLDGPWRSADFKRRQWNAAYGVNLPDIHRAMLLLMYPAYPDDVTRGGATVHIWDLKQRCEAVVQFMSRYGRIVRAVNQNNKRRIRQDAPKNIRNYFARVRGRLGPTSNAPVRNVCLSGYYAFRDALILGEAPVSAAPKSRGTGCASNRKRSQRSGSSGGDGGLADHPNYPSPFVMEEITTSPATMRPFTLEDLLSCRVKMPSLPPTLGSFQALYTDSFGFMSNTSLCNSAVIGMSSAIVKRAVIYDDDYDDDDDDEVDGEFEDEFHNARDL